MKWVIVSLVFMLGGCVTIVMPQNEPRPVTSTAQCDEYQPPAKRMPPTPAIVEEVRRESYTGFVEQISERMARYVRQLELHIDLVDADHRDAYYRYQLSCKDQ